MKKILSIVVLLFLLVGMAGAIPDPFKILQGQQMIPLGSIWTKDSAVMYFGTDKDVGIKFDSTNNRLAVTVPTEVSGSTNSVEQTQVQTIGTTTTAPEASDDDQIFAAIPANNTTHILATSSGVGSSTFLAAPDFARNIIVTPSASATGSLKLTGTNIAGTAITENLTLAGAGVVASTKAFKAVTQIDGTFTQTTVRTLKIGTGDLLGLNQKLATNTVQMAALNDVREATAPAVTVSSTTLSLNTIDLNSAYSATSPVKIWFFK
jgi:hypothetical protein